MIFLHSTSKLLKCWHLKIDLYITNKNMRLKAVVLRELQVSRKISQRKLFQRIYRFLTFFQPEDTSRLR